MDTFLIDVPMPSMGATVNELTVIAVKTQPGEAVKKGQKLAELESDKSVFEFEAPCDGTIRGVLVKAGDVIASGAPFLQIETADASLRHLESKATAKAGGATAPAAAPMPAAALVWTPRAVKLAQEAGLDHTQITDIEATGPGGRVSGDDVTRYLASRKS
ncbi:biotin/lipoyl-containing protein [Opitutus sp. ER46]|uniref:biotin/lipoyl-containing protein n=1 Tax=Opitutus sp. ER46 TaxID=2161864 RepID=UPI001E509693|nr:biotin/lipoyl-containing protein [Opitutus sp. ER46]